MYKFWHRILCREGMQEIKASKVENIIIDCSYEILDVVLTQAQQVGILSDKYKVIVTSLVRHTSVFPLKFKVKNYRTITVKVIS